MNILALLFVDSPHIVEALIGGLAVGVVSALVGWLQGRDIRTRLVVRVEDNTQDIQELQITTRNHDSRIVRLETKVEGL